MLFSQPVYGQFSLSIMMMSSLALGRWTQLSCNVCNRPPAAQTILRHRLCFRGINTVAIHGVLSASSPEVYKHIHSIKKKKKKKQAQGLSRHRRELVSEPVHTNWQSAGVVRSVPVHRYLEFVLAAVVSQILPELCP